MNNKITTGKVVEQGTFKPIEGVTVTLPSGNTGVTDSRGEYTIYGGRICDICGAEGSGNLRIKNAKSAGGMCVQVALL